MKFLFVLFVVTVTQGYVLERVKREVDLPKPSLISIIAIDPPGFRLEWRSVTSDKETVLGYKVKVWELPYTRTYSYKTIDGVRTLVEELTPPSLSAKTPEGEPKEFTTDKTTFVYTEVRLGALYEARVQAFSNSGDGPVSEPVRIRLGLGDDHQKDSYQIV